MGYSLKTVLSFFLVALCLIPSTGAAQIDIRQYTSATDTFYWKRYTHIPAPKRVNLKKFTSSKSEKRLAFFLTDNRSDFTQFQRDSAQPLPVADLKKYIFQVDINGDRMTDMIFCGPDGGASEIVKIWINRSDSFELVFEDYQYISRYLRVNGRLSELQTSEVGQGPGYLYFTRDYKVSFEENAPVFVKGKQTVAYKYTEEPFNYLPAPVQFTALADTMMLRASAARLNEPFHPDLDSFGNIVAKYRSKARGVVLAQKSAGKGNVWYYVEVSPSVAPSASILYGTDKFPTFIRGWVSGQAIQMEE